MLCDCVTRGCGEHSPLTTAAILEWRRRIAECALSGTTESRLSRLSTEYNEAGRTTAFSVQTADPFSTAAGEDWMLQAPSTLLRPDHPHSTLFVLGSTVCSKRSDRRCSSAAAASDNCSLRLQRRCHVGITLAQQRAKRESRQDDALTCHYCVTCT